MGRITNIFDVVFFQPTTPINNPPYNQPAIGSAMAGSYTYVPTTFGNGIEVGSLVGGYGTAFAYDDFSGNWEAVPVPEPSAASLILLGALAALPRLLLRN